MPGTSEPLVPNNLPYGERQAQVEQMRQAGLPLAPRQGAGNPSGVGAMAAQSGAAPPFGGAAPPSAFPAGGEMSDPLLSMTPNEPYNYQPADPNADLRRLAAVTPNRFLQAVIAEMMAGRNA